MSKGFPFMDPTGSFPFTMPTGSDGDAEAMDMWMKPGVEAFRFWISFFPTAPLFGVEWRFQNMVDPAANPFMMSGMASMPGMPTMPGTRAAAMASYPGELASPAAADEDAAKPVARAADTAGDAATEMTRIAGETGKAVARTADRVMRTGADAAKAAVDAEARAVDVAEKTGQRAKQATETAMTAVEDTAKTTENAAEEATKETARKTEREATKALKATEAAAEATARKTADATSEATANATADAVDEAIAAAPKPKMLLGKRPAETDDLKAIKGIGPDLERQLNGLGLYRFDQLAKMTDADLAWIDTNITRFKGRCFRDDWVGQAKSRLAK